MGSRPYSTPGGLTRPCRSWQTVVQLSRLARSNAPDRYTPSVLHDIARKGSESNVAWLLERYGDNVKVVEGDIRDRDDTLLRLVDEVEAVFHLAAQVAVTTSVVNS